MNERDTGSSAPTSEVMVWDPFVRVFHWSLVIGFFGAYLLGEDGGQLHQMAGYFVLCLIAARVVWGVAGTRYARFTDFVPTLAGATRYLAATLKGREPRYLGHNPAGGAMIVALLVTIALTGLTGWLMTTGTFWGSEAIEDLHEGFAATVLFLVVAHVAGVIFSSLRHRENLVKAMITGRKRKN
jgi:cytochrome b